ncbi:hypothetical protein [Nocardia takedensis]|uniref:hypothetical protein n=1 Tax=Nocardia takedensis TaxID=259390 RepID=UPI0002DCEF07|nr:hypothetical protein [Nocardia takedensis]
MDDLSATARQAVTLAIELAAASNARAAGAEHLPVALLANDYEATAPLEAMGVDLLKLRKAASELARIG